VITSWSTYTGGTVNQGPVRLKVIRPVSATTFKVVAASAYITPIYLADGNNGPFNVRIPVVANDLVALGVGPRNGLAAGAMAKIGMDDPPDEASVLTWGAAGHPTYRVSVSASLEADLDRDGFGDETQDQCPATAGAQNGCPRYRPRSSRRSVPCTSRSECRRGQAHRQQGDLHAQRACADPLHVRQRPPRPQDERWTLRRPHPAATGTRAAARELHAHRHRGSNAFRFSGRIAHKRLKPGRYKLVATPTCGRASASCTRSARTSGAARAAGAGAGRSSGRRLGP
jgi:hypothetical protein